MENPIVIVNNKVYALDLSKLDLNNESDRNIIILTYDVIVTFLAMYDEISLLANDTKLDIEEKEVLNKYLEEVNPLIPKLYKSLEILENFAISMKEDLMKIKHEHMFKN